MRTPNPFHFVRSLAHKTLTSRPFSSGPHTQAKNRIYPSRIRSESELSTLLLMSASTRTPLLTFWMATWCSTCSATLPLLLSLLQKEGIGEAQGGIGFVEVEMDSPDLGGLSGVGMRYGIRSLPTLLAFDRQEAQVETRVSRLGELKDRRFLVEWIEREAARQGEGGAGGSLGGWLGIGR